MCWPQGNGGTKETVVQDQTVAPAPVAPPQAPAATPSPNQSKSPETQNSANPNVGGYAALIIPRTAFTPVSADVPRG